MAACCPPRHYQGLWRLVQALRPAVNKIGPMAAPVVTALGEEVKPLPAFEAGGPLPCPALPSLQVRPWLGGVHAPPPSAPFASPANRPAAGGKRLPLIDPPGGMWACTSEDAMDRAPRSTCPGRLQLDIFEYQ